MLGAAVSAEAAPKTHRLEPSPTTVAYGHYWSQSPPVLRIASGDFLDVDTVMGGNPEKLARAGVPDAKIPAAMKAIVSQLTGDRKGPGGHMLTGPIYIEGAEPGDVLEVKILSIELTTDFGTNACKGLLPENCEKDLPNKVPTRPDGRLEGTLLARHLQDSRSDGLRDAESAAFELLEHGGHCDDARPFLGEQEDPERARRR
jgi:hypothetical protein